MNSLLLSVKRAPSFEPNQRTIGFGIVLADSRVSLLLLERRTCLIQRHFALQDLP